MCVERHELDEAHADSLGAPERSEVDDFVVVHTAHDDAVDLHGMQARVERGVDAREHTVELVAPGQLTEGVATQRVERHVDAPQSRGGEVVRELGETHAVRRHREVGAERSEHREQPSDVRRAASAHHP